MKITVSVPPPLPPQDNRNPYVIVLKFLSELVTEMQQTAFCQTDSGPK